MAKAGIATGKFGINRPENYTYGKIHPLAIHINIHLIRNQCFCFLVIEPLSSDTKAKLNTSSIPNINIPKVAYFSAVSLKFSFSYSMFKILLIILKEAICYNIFIEVLSHINMKDSITYSIESFLMEFPTFCLRVEFKCVKWLLKIT